MNCVTSSPAPLPKGARRALSKASSPLCRKPEFPYHLAGPPMMPRSLAGRASPSLPSVPSRCATGVRHCRIGTITCFLMSQATDSGPPLVGISRNSFVSQSHPAWCTPQARCPCRDATGPTVWGWVGSQFIFKAFIGIFFSLWVASRREKTNPCFKP